jgi:hypothetical protein
MNGATASIPDNGVVLPIPSATTPGNHTVGSTSADRFIRWPRMLFAFVATAALLTLTLGGIYLTIVNPESGGPGSHPNGSIAAASPGTGTPTGSPSDIAGWYGGTLSGGNRVISHSTFMIQQFPADQLDVSNAQLQSWSLQPGAVMTFEGNETGEIRGLAVDSPTSGTYAAVYDSPVVVSRGEVNGWSYEQISAGTSIEIDAGDSVTYVLGTKRTISNPLSLTVLEFKSALFHNNVLPNIPTAVGVAIVVDGDGTLLRPLGTNTNGPVVSLMYNFMRPGYPLPDNLYGFHLVIGPVAGWEDPLYQGYTLWVGEGRG